MTEELAAGTVVGGRYRLDRLIAEGGMGALWAAFRVGDEGRARFAVKLRKTGAAVDATMRRRMLREARTISAVRHPNVVAIHDVLELDDGTPALVMDLLEGESLRAKLARERTLPLGEAARLLLEVIAGVSCAHALGIVHRDLKPENVFLAQGEGGTTVKVLDFGIAKLTASDGGAAQTEALTGTGALLGTPDYMAPEQILGEADVDGRTDIWALGVVLYECLTGARPADDESVGKVLKRVINGALRPIVTLAPQLPPELVRLVDRMLAADPAARPADLAEVRAALEPLARSTLPALRPPHPSAIHTATTAQAGLSGSVDAGAPTLAAPSAQPVTAPRAGPSARLRRLLALAALTAIAGAGTLAWDLASRRSRLPVPDPMAIAPTSTRCPGGMALIAGGVFTMGADDGADDEGPGHPVTVGDVCMDVGEVTVGAYSACVEQGKCRPPASSVDYPDVRNEDRQFESGFCDGVASNLERMPINCVSWTQADACCRAQGKRLPTEAEWEYAAGGGAEHRRYAWGDAPPGPTRLNACGEECAEMYAAAGRTVHPMYPESDGKRAVAAPGSFPAGDSRHGLHDMLGNLWEWTSSPYCAYPGHDCDSPYRVFRGGGFATTLGHRVRTTSRIFSRQQYRYMDVGFRCAKDAGP